MRKEAGANGETCGVGGSDAIDDGMGCDMTLNFDNPRKEENLRLLQKHILSPCPPGSLPKAGMSSYLDSIFGIHPQPILAGTDIAITIGKAALAR